MTDALKKMNKLLGPNYPLNAQCIYVQRDKSTFLMLEDLMPLGFGMADRLTGLDMNHCLLAIRGLARFHAASVALCEKVKSYFFFITRRNGKYFLVTLKRGKILQKMLWHK